MRKYIPWIVICLCLWLGVITLATTWITEYKASDWGLVSRMPVTFWVGLGLVILLIYLGRESTTILGISAALLLFYLYAIPTLVNENGIEFSHASYFTYGEGLLLARNGHLITDATTALARYHDWPAFLYLSAILSEITGITSFAIPHYFPIFSAALLGLFAFIILRIGLETKLALIGTMWILASGFNPQVISFLPQGMGILLTLPIFFLLARRYHTGLSSMSSRAMILLLFLVLVITHVFTSLATVFAIAGIFVLGSLFAGRRRLESAMPALLAVIFLAYTLYVTAPVFELGVRRVYATIVGEYDNPVSSLLGIPQNASRYLYWTFASGYATVALNILIGGSAILYALVRGKSARDNSVFWVGWLAGLVLAGSFAYESDGWIRAFSLGLVPVGFLCVSLLRKKGNVLLAVLALLIIINIPAHYGNTLRIDRHVTAAELAGREFYAKHTPLDTRLFYQGTEQSWASDPVRARIPVLYLNMPPKDPDAPALRFRPNEPAEKVILEEAEYIIDSDVEREEEKYILGYDFMERLKLDSWGDLFYNNGHVRIYKAIR